MINLAQSLKLLKKAGICHLDLHPGNILVEESMLTKLIDFGEAYSEKLPYSKGRNLVK